MKMYTVLIENYLSASHAIEIIIEYKKSSFMVRSDNDIRQYQSKRIFMNSLFF